MTDIELEVLKEQAKELNEGNYLVILVALIKARAIENASRDISEALNYIARCTNG